MIGSSERVFYGNQFTVMAPLFAHNNVAVWIPELGGAADPHTTGHEELMVLLGILAKREVARPHPSPHLHDRPSPRPGPLPQKPAPYGYRLIDARPHPNRALARRGVQRQRLDPDPHTAPVVTLIFTQRLTARTPLISEIDYIAAQKIRTPRTTATS